MTNTTDTSTCPEAQAPHDRGPPTVVGNTAIHLGDCREILKSLSSGSIHCCVTSPPYFGLRDYGHGQQIGMEQTPDAFVAELVSVFREVRRVLRDDGTLWLNLGDSYAAQRGASHMPAQTVAGGIGGKGDLSAYRGMGGQHAKHSHRNASAIGLKHKDLIGIPWRVAFALQADGWYLRQDIIWHKPNPMPESVRDRCTKSHEYIFLLSKSEKYYFDADAIAEPLAESSLKRLSQNVADQHGSDRVRGKTNGSMKAVARGGSTAFRGQGHFRNGNGAANREGRDMHKVGASTTSRNRRSVWTVTTKPFKGAHFATFPPDLIEPCILAGCPEGGTVIDPFFGAGTTGLVAAKHNRRCIGIELNPDYRDLAVSRLRGEKIASPQIVGDSSRQAVDTEQQLSMF